MQVSAVMTAPVITVRPDDSLSEAIALLDYHKLSGLAVVDRQGQLCGILSEGDLLRRIELGSAPSKDNWWSILFETNSLAEAYKKANGRKVSDMMTKAPVTIGPEATLADAARLMEDHRIKRLPVIGDGTLVGILSRSDFVKALSRFVAPSYEEQATSDGEIKERIDAELSNQKWSMDCRIRVEVKDGRVKLSGNVPSNEHKSAATIAAENVVGVVAVDDEIKLTPTVPIYAM